MYLEEKNKGLALTSLAKVIIILAGVVLGFLLSRIIILPFTIPNDSMSPNLRKGDIVFILKHIPPKVGDIVLFTSPVEPDRVLLKRVIAKNGDTIEIIKKIIYKNNRKFEFSWKTLSNDYRIFPMNFSFRDNLPIIKIKPKEFFVIGDNLDYSFDSRSFGVINATMIIGKLILKI